MLCANPSTYHDHSADSRDQFIALRSDLSREVGGSGLAGSQVARSVRNEDPSLVGRYAIGPDVDRPQSMCVVI